MAGSNSSFSTISWALKRLLILISCYFPYRPAQPYYLYEMISLLESKFRLTIFFVFFVEMVHLFTKRDRKGYPLNMIYLFHQTIVHKVSVDIHTSFSLINCSCSKSVLLWPTFGSFLWKKRTLPSLILFKWLTRTESISFLVISLRVCHVHFPLEFLLKLVFAMTWCLGVVDFWLSVIDYHYSLDLHGCPCVFIYLLTKWKSFDMVIWFYNS